MNFKKKTLGTIADITFTANDPATLTLTISGQLNADTFAVVWHKAQSILKRYQPEHLLLETKGITYCDSIGAVIILELKKMQQQAGKKFSLQNLSPEISKILSFLETKERTQPAQADTKVSFVVNLGKGFVVGLANTRENIIFLGAVFVHLWHFFLHPRSMRWQDFWRAMQDVGPKAVPIICLIGFLVGLITTFQSAEPMGRFGAQIYIINLAGLGLVREMGPLMTSVLLAGRTASAFSAEIGAMKINQEIDALSTMGLDAVRFLTIPRILAGLIMTPILSMLLILSGLFGCFLVMLTLGYNPHIFLNELYKIVTLKDFISGLIKTLVFGAIITSIGCLQGIKTKIGASAVGDSATKAVVNSLIMLVIVDGIFAAVYYTLGI